MQFTDILIEKKIINSEELSKLINLSRERKISLEKLLKAQGISGDEIIKAKSEAIGVPFKSLSGKKIPFEALKQIPEEAARHYKFVPLGFEG
ncbi:MAG TPA: hypothetical protein ENG99_00765, partial [bacterium]|nr:hypothetical protein [bacterium]